MSKLYKILASCRSDHTTSAIETVLSDVPDARLEMRNGVLHDVLNDVKSGRRIDLMILDVDLSEEEELKELTDIIDQTPAGFPVIATSSHASVDRIRLLMRLGLADFVPQPIVEQDLLNSITVARRNYGRIVTTDRGSSGRIIGVTRAAGGMGATTLAVNAAHLLATDKQKPYNVALVDLDMQRGSAALYLNIESTVGVFDCLIEPQKIDSTLVQSCISTHSDGLDVLTAPNEAISLDSISPLAVETLLDVMRETYDVLVVDLPPVWTLWSEDVAALCDMLLIPTHMSVAAIRQTRRLIDHLEAMQLRDLPVKIITNRVDKRLFSRGVRLKDAEKALGHKVDASLPDEPDIITEAQNEGVPVSSFKRGTRFEKALRSIIDKSVEDIRVTAAADRAVAEIRAN